MTFSRTWEDKKKALARRQEEFQEARRVSTKKLKRTRVNGQGRLMTDYEVWPAEPPILQRIANFMDRPISPHVIMKRLEKGEKLTTRTGSVYSLVPLTSH